MKSSGSKALVNQQKQALAAQQAQAAVSNQNLAAEQATVQTGGTADANAQPTGNSLLKKNRQTLSGSLGLNV